MCIDVKGWENVDVRNAVVMFHNVRSDAQTAPEALAKLFAAIATCKQ